MNLPQQPHVKKCQDVYLGTFWINMRQSKGRRPIEPMAGHVKFPV
ncbi:hypothetical protein ABAC402_04780 [Asticcacaulis sp. AC402]|nr:hypothetical protein ABAC402_04780 [Asticcacaulis sp. AC402]